MIITIDGPAGSGKSSTAKAVAKKTGWFYLDSGSLYRTFTLLFLKYGKSKSELLAHLNNHSVDLEVDGEEVLTMLDGEDVGDSIRIPEVSGNVSKVSSWEEIRNKVNSIMRKTVQKHNFIADGRDLGSVVFPDAAAKIFLTASIEERAKRRYKELKEKGIESNLEEIKQNLADRDQQDSTRKIAPLIKPDNAIVIDTTSKKLEDQVRQIAEIVERVG